MAIEKKLLYANGCQRFAHLALVDSAGCFCLMLDSNENVRFKFSDEADLIGQMSEQQAGLEDRLVLLAERNAALAVLAQDMYQKLVPKYRGVLAKRMESLGVDLPQPEALP